MFCRALRSFCRRVAAYQRTRRCSGRARSLPRARSCHCRAVWRRSAARLAWITSGTRGKTERACLASRRPSASPSRTDRSYAQARRVCYCRSSCCLSHDRNTLSFSGSVMGLASSRSFYEEQMAGFEEAWSDASISRDGEAVSPQLRPLLYQVYVQVLEEPKNLPALKNCLVQLLTFLAGDGRSNANCWAVDLFF